MKRDSIETFRLPFTLAEVLDDLRMTIWCTASQLALLGKLDWAIALTVEDADFGMSEMPNRYLDRIDLEALDITKVVRSAYDFAFQVGDFAQFNGERWAEMQLFVRGSVRTSWSGDISPTFQEDSKLRHVADMMEARIHLMQDDALTIRHLSLLANMTEAAVRSALSAEGIKTEGRPASLPAKVASVWLKGRRGYVPTRDGKAIDEFASSDLLLEVRPFPGALKQMIQDAPGSEEDIAKDANFNLAELRDLTAGVPVDVTVPALVRLAKRLRADPEAFMSSYVRFLGAA